MTKKSITDTAAYICLEKLIFLNGAYRELRNYYIELFEQYACIGDTENLKNDIDTLFSKTSGIPYMFSNITFDDSDESIYTNVPAVKDSLYKLKQTFFNKFHYHIRHKYVNGILNKFQEIDSELENLPRRFLKVDR